MAAKKVYNMLHIVCICLFCEYVRQAWCATFHPCVYIWSVNNIHLFDCQEWCVTCHQLCGYVCEQYTGIWVPSMVCNMSPIMWICFVCEQNIGIWLPRIVCNMSPIVWICLECEQYTYQAPQDRGF